MTRDEMILNYLPLAKTIAKCTYKKLPLNCFVQFEDLVSVATLGLIKAVDRYDKSYKFAPYAEFVIKGHIHDELRHVDYLSRETRRRVKRIESVISELQQILFRNPTEYEISKRIGISLEEYRELVMPAIFHISLHELQNDEGTYPSEWLADKTPTFLQNLEKKEIADDVKYAISLLSPRRKQIANMIYYKEMTQKETGLKLGICESRVSQLLKDIHDFIYRYLKRKYENNKTLSAAA